MNHPFNPISSTANMALVEDAWRIYYANLRYPSGAMSENTTLYVISIPATTMQDA